MNHKVFFNRINRIAKEHRGKDLGLSVILQYPDESDEQAQQRAEHLMENDIRNFDQPGLFVVVRNYARMEVKDVSKP